MSCLSNARFWFPIVFSFLLAACGGGGGSGSSSQTPPSGSLVITEVDSDHDGLIEIASLEQLDWIRNNPAGTSLIDFAGQVNSKGCPASGCFGYELVADLDFDTNGDGVLNNKDTYYDYDKNGSNSGWRPISRLEASFEGNGHHIRNLYINRPDDDNNYDGGLFGLVVIDPTNNIKIQNVVLDGPFTSVVGKYDSAILIGELTNQGQFSINHVSVTGSVISKGSIAAGLVGAIFSSDNSILNLDNNLASTTISSGLVGGLIGTITTGNTNVQLVVTDNTASSIVDGESAGGLFGNLLASNASMTFTGNSSSGSVEATLYGGGLISGLNFGKGIFQDNHSTASVEAIGMGSNAGGLIGSLSLSANSISNIYSSGSVTSSGHAGGLIGELNCSDNSYVKESYTIGNVDGLFTVTNSNGSQSITGGYAGGLVGVIHAPNSGTCGIKQSYSSGTVSSGPASGGLVGNIDSYNAMGTIELSDNISTGTVSAFLYSGGLLGQSSGVNGMSIVVTRNLSLGRVTIDPSASGVGVIGYGGGLAGTVGVFSPSTAIFSFNYWASDTTTTSYSIASPSASVVETGNLSASLTSLECPVSANNFSCASGELFHDWDSSQDSQGQPVWDFGNTIQLPGLRIGNSIYRPVYDGSRYTVETENL
jgi:hypothetical protein